MKKIVVVVILVITSFTTLNVNGQVKNNDIAMQTVSLSTSADKALSVQTAKADLNLLQFQPRQCPTCEGIGSVYVDVKRNCPNCGGDGKDDVIVNGEVIKNKVKCQQCNGKGTYLSREVRKCSTCGGKGTIN
ncbi:MAG: hypothetical protein LBR28_02860 [Bacteroidales bacterium]|jgi:DnaJ-class molecular chaperone|nr:hypothetical protein [Bacteroidales bacterium]